MVSCFFLKIHILRVKFSACTHTHTDCYNNVKCFPPEEPFLPLQRLPPGSGAGVKQRRASSSGHSALHLRARGFLEARAARGELGEGTPSPPPASGAGGRAPSEAPSTERQGALGRWLEAWGARGRRNCCSQAGCDCSALLIGFRGMLSWLLLWGARGVFW